MHTVAFIPIRSGSKGIPNKNIKDFCDKPLIYWMAKAASFCIEIDQVVVAVDSDEYARVVESFELPKVQVYRRSFENSRDGSQTEDVMLEYLDKFDSTDPEDIFVLIQATSPLTTSDDLNEALLTYKNNPTINSMLSAVEFKRFLWNRNQSGLGDPYNYNIFRRPLRQQWEGSYLENGSFYINTISNVLHSKCRLSGNVYVYPLPEWHQYEIDGTEDWEVMENIFREKILQYQ